MTRLVYVAGYGRSGSTILDAYIGRELCSSGGGELWRLFDEYATDGTCSCGKPLPQCPVWGPVTQKALETFGTDVETASAITRSAEFGNSGHAEWSRLWHLVFEEYGSVTGAPTLIDSSKTSGGQRRLSLLRQFSVLGEQMIVVHLVRHPTAVGASLYKGKNSQLAKGIKTGAVRRNFDVGRGAIGWIRANDSAANFRDLGPRYLTMSYESFVKDPHQLVRALQKLGIGASDRPPSAPHVVAGNRALHVHSGKAIRVQSSPAGTLPRLWQPAMRGLEIVGTRKGWFKP